jgi:hypothetical protein
MDDMREELRRLADRIHRVAYRLKSRNHTDLKQIEAELRQFADHSPDAVNMVAGEVVEIGDDESGQPRILIHTTREDIKSCRTSLLFKRVSVTPQSNEP